MNEQNCEHASSGIGLGCQTGPVWMRIGFSRMTCAVLILTLPVTASAWDKYGPMLAGLMATVGIVVFRITSGN